MAGTFGHPGELPGEDLCWAEKGREVDLPPLLSPLPYLLCTYKFLERVQQARLQYPQ